MITRADFVRVLALLVSQPYQEARISDDDIKHRIEAEMKAQHWAPAALVRVVVKEGVVDLTGVLTDERERNAIHVLVENIDGVRTLHDHIVCAKPFSGMVMPSPEDLSKGTAV